jgi:hypothetical protein
MKPIILDDIGTQLWLRDSLYTQTDRLNNPVCTIKYRDRIKATCMCRTSLGHCDGSVLSSDSVVLFKVKP